MKKLILTLSILFTQIAFTQDYYDSQTIQELKNGSLRDTKLHGFVGRVASKNFKGLGYKSRAKNFLFGNVDLKKDEKGYYVLDVYCNYEIRENVGPMRIPKNETMNVEHTWPQSKGSKAEPARGDLHHLFPTDSRANSSRGNHPFGEVSTGKDARDNCEISQRGQLKDPQSGRTSSVYGFEPPIEHRGNVARAMFYVSTKYKYEISAIEEFYLRKWHNEDPVDAEEIKRNDMVQNAQGNRNPFVDFPSLESKISNF